MKYETEFAVYHGWTRKRKAKFVEYRMQGLSTHWAVFWATIDRKQSIECKGKVVYAAERVDAFIAARDDVFQRFWTKPMEGVDAREHMPPQELFEQLEETQ